MVEQRRADSVRPAGRGRRGDRHSRYWEAIGVPRRERGQRTDAALAVLPDLIARKAVDIDGAPVQLAPGLAVPPIIVGGMADAALASAVAHGDGWFTLPLLPAQLFPLAERLAELADDLDRPMRTNSTLAQMAPISYKTAWGAWVMLELDSRGLERERRDGDRIDDPFDG